MKSIQHLTQRAMRHRQIVLLITGVLILFGVYALAVMPRQEFPEFTIRQGIIVGVFPGAQSQKVEDQLTTKVENYLFGFNEVDKSKTYSISEEGRMYIFVELCADVKNPDLFWAKLRHGLNDLKLSLPQEVLALIATNDFGDTSAMILTVQSKSRSYKELEAYLKLLENELRALPAASKIKHFGLQKEKINIYIDNEKLAFYGINPVTVLAILKTEGSVTYAGEVDNGRLSMPVHLEPRYRTEASLAEQIIYTDPRGIAIRLKDVARVVREYEEPDSYIQSDGNRCVIVSMEMQRGNNIVSFGSDVDEVIADVSKRLPSDVQIAKIADMPQAVDGSINSFMREFIIAIIAVIAVTMLLLPFRVSSIAAVTIPVSIMITLGIIYVVGIELHTVSLAALIVVLGMVVDNAIVIIDNYVEELDMGIDPWTAAWKSATDLFVPVVSATLAIIAAFVPMAYFLTGLGQEFVETFPSTISVALGVSLLVAVLLVPIMTYTLIKKGLADGKKEGKRSFLDRVQSSYDAVIVKAFKHRRAVIFGALAIIALTVVFALQLPSMLLPKIDRAQFAVEIYLPKGSSLDRTAETVNHLQKRLMQDKRVEHVTAFVGTSSPRFHTLYAPNIPSKSYAQLIVNTVSNDATLELLDYFSANYVSPNPDARIRWKQIEFSTSKAPVEVRISGDEIPAIKGIADSVSTLLRRTEGVTWVRTDYEDPLHGVRLAVNEDEANRLGFTKAMIAYTIAAGMKGFPLATVWEGDYPVDVVLRQEQSGKGSIKDIDNMYVTSPMGFSSVRARNVMTPEPDWTEGAIIRRNGVRTITVRADVERGYYAYNAFNDVTPAIERLKLPAGVAISYGGEHESEIENYVPLAISLATSIVVIFFILLFQFSTIRLSLLIMSTIPLSAFGAVLGLFLLSYPFGMTAFVGVISLCGMVVRNGIIYIDYAEYLRKEKGMDLREAAISAGRRRMRPIFLTAAAAAVGVIPMILSRSPLWGPLGTVVCFGLLFAMVLTLVILPVLYSLYGPKHDAVFPEGGIV